MPSVCTRCALTPIARLLVDSKCAVIFVGRRSLCYHCWGCGLVHTYVVAVCLHTVVCSTCVDLPVRLHKGLAYACSAAACRKIAVETSTGTLLRNGMRVDQHFHLVHMHSMQPNPLASG